jgi:hypothetical protein
MTSEHRSPETIRGMLDYLCWISVQMLAVGAHSGQEKDSWRDRVQRAYSAVFIPPVPGRGDPYPPDVPPAKNPGIWPDVPSSGIPGMTLRHQLTVLGMVCEQLRRDPWVNARPTEIADWDRRLSAARVALDHGPSATVPEDARTKPSATAARDAEARDRAVRDAARKRIRRAEAALASQKRSKGGKSPAPKAKAAKSKPAAKTKARPKAKKRR